MIRSRPHEALKRGPVASWGAAPAQAVPGGQERRPLGRQAGSHPAGRNRRSSRRNSSPPGSTKRTASDSRTSDHPGRCSARQPIAGHGMRSMANCRQLGNQIYLGLTPSAGSPSNCFAGSSRMNACARQAGSTPKTHLNSDRSSRTGPPGVPIRHRIARSQRARAGSQSSRRETERRRLGPAHLWRRPRRARTTHNDTSHPPLERSPRAGDRARQVPHLERHIKAGHQELPGKLPYRPMPSRARYRDRAHLAATD